MTLKRYERVDLFWGRIKDVERDFLYAHAFVAMLMFSTLIYFAVQGAVTDQKYLGNI